MTPETERSNVVQAADAFDRSLRNLYAAGHLLPEREGREQPDRFRRRLLAHLESLKLDDPTLRLDLEIAQAYLRYLLDEDRWEDRTSVDIHPQVSHTDLPFEVDEKILPLIHALWTRDYHTIASCQAAEYGGGWAEVTFDRVADAQRMIAVCVTAADAWGDVELFGRVSGDTPGGGKYRGYGGWDVSSRIASHSIFSSGTPGLHPFMVSIYLPPSDIEAAARAIEEFSGYKANRWAALSP